MTSSAKQQVLEGKHLNFKSPSSQRNLILSPEVFKHTTSKNKLQWGCEIKEFYSVLILFFFLSTLLILYITYYIDTEFFLLSEKVKLRYSMVQMVNILITRCLWPLHNQLLFSTSPSTGYSARWGLAQQPRCQPGRLLAVVPPEVHCSSKANGMGTRSVTQR